MTNFTPLLGFALPVPGDQAIKNSWGTLLDVSDFSLIDTSIAGILPLNVAGNSNVALTYVQGSADQSRNPQFVLTGELTGSILILWPQTVTRKFGVVNNTTGDFSITLCVNNGSGVAAGTTQVLPQGIAATFYSDGTNIEPDQTGFVGNLSVVGDINGITTIFNGSVSASGTDTGIATFAISQARGVTLIAYCAAQNGVGDQTLSAIYMLRFPNTGSGVTATRIALDPGSTGLGDFIFSSNGSAHLVVTAPGASNTLVNIQQVTG